MSDQTPDQPHDQASDSSGAALPAPRKRIRPRCAICGKDARAPIRFDAVRPEIASLIVADYPDLKPNDHICERHLNEYRSRYVAHLLASERGELSDLEKQVVESLAREETVSRDVESAWEHHRTVGERVADAVADFGGSWVFIGIFFAVLVVWMAFNVVGRRRAPFSIPILLSCSTWCFRASPPSRRRSS